MTIEDLIKLRSEFIRAEVEKGEPLFLGIPDRWYEKFTVRCVNGHISHHIIKSELLGDLCPECNKPCIMTFPEDTETKYNVSSILIQFSPDLTSGERLNIGVLLACEKLKFIDVKFDEEMQRILFAFPNTDLKSLKTFKENFKISLSNHKNNIDMSNAWRAYHNIMPKMDSSIIISEPFYGITNEPEKLLSVLYYQYIMKHYLAPNKKEP